MQLEKQSEKLSQEVVCQDYRKCWGTPLEEMNEKILIKMTIAVTRPDEVDSESIKKYLPIGKKEVQVISGGLKVRGINVPEFGDVDDSIEAAVACIEVCIIDKEESL